MKKILKPSSFFLPFFFLFHFFCIGQNKTIPNSFIIHGDIGKDKLAFYTKSIEAADFEQFRLKSEPLILKFKNGFELELLSAKDLIVKNKEQKIDINRYVEIKPTDKYPLFQVLDSGWIAAEAASLTK
jgi:hypothetical protein